LPPGTLIRLLLILGSAKRMAHEEQTRLIVLLLLSRAANVLRRREFR
jgi:hypothetical protein